MKKLISISLLTFVLDVVIKLIITNNLSYNQSVVVINNFFNITLVKNTGGAFSLFSGKVFYLIIISVFILFMIIYYIYKNKINDNLTLIGFALLLGGAMGNLFDRIYYGYVVDYLDFKFLGMNFPIFNMADVCIVVSCLLLFFLGVFYDNRKDY